MMCPIVEKTIIDKENSPWFNNEVKCAIKERRRKEKKWRIKRTVESREEYVRANNFVNRLIRKRKCIYYREMVTDAGSDPRKLYSLLNNLSGKKRKKHFQEGFRPRSLQITLHYFLTTR